MDTGQYTLELRDLTVEVGGKTLLQGLNLAIPRGEVHALLGPNGSGKTSLMMTIMGFERYHVLGGQILFLGQDVTQLDLGERAKVGIAIAQQRPPTIPGVKLRDILDYTVGGDQLLGQQVEEWIKIARADAFLARDINAGLSGGEIKRAELLQLLAMQPAFSMMDEPDSGVDLESLALLGNLVNMLFSRNTDRPVQRKSGLLITHTGHILNYVHADKAHILLDGQIACSGNPRLILDTVSRSGYQECVGCFKKERA